MAVKQKSFSVLICCEAMLGQIGRTVVLDEIHWPHLRDAWPPLKFCPWCRHEMPFKEIERDEP